MHKTGQGYQLQYYTSLVSAARDFYLSENKNLLQKLTPGWFISTLSELVMLTPFHSLCFHLNLSGSGFSVFLCLQAF